MNKIVEKSTRQWYIVDAKDKILGRICPKIADLLRGKNKVNFVKYQDMGDNVVIINAAKVRLSGKKGGQKKYYHHSGYMGGLRTETFDQLIKRHPEEVIYQAVSGMLPRNRLKKLWLRRLRIYPGDQHPHEAQKVIEKSFI